MPYIFIKAITRFHNLTTDPVSYGMARRASTLESVAFSTRTFVFGGTSAPVVARRNMVISGDTPYWDRPPGHHLHLFMTATFRLVMSHRRMDGS